MYLLLFCLFQHLFFLMAWEIVNHHSRSFFIISTYHSHYFLFLTLFSKANHTMLTEKSIDFFCLVVIRLIFNLLKDNHSILRQLREGFIQWQYLSHPFKALIQPLTFALYFNVRDVGLERFIFSWAVRIACFDTEFISSFLRFKEKNSSFISPFLFCPVLPSLQHLFQLFFLMCSFWCLSNFSASSAFSQFYFSLSSLS